MKIRRRRNTDWEPSDEDFPEARAPADAASETTDESRPFEGYEGADDSGASWLSNNVIIGSLSDNKLRAALARHKALVRLCEAELAARASETRKPVKLGNRRSGEPGVENRQMDARNSAPHKRPRQAKQQLAPEQMLKALEMLMNLKNKKDKP